MDLDDSADRGEEDDEHAMGVLTNVPEDVVAGSGSCAEKVRGKDEGERVEEAKECSE